MRIAFLLCYHLYMYDDTAMPSPHTLVDALQLVGASHFDSQYLPTGYPRNFLAPRFTPSRRAGRFIRCTADDGRQLTSRHYSARELLIPFLNVARARLRAMELSPMYRAMICVADVIVTVSFYLQARAKLTRI